MKKLLVICSMAVMMFTASSCNIADDIEYDRKEKLTFEVQEVKADDLIAGRPELKKRSDQLKELKKAEEEKNKEEQKVEDNKKWTVTTGELNIRSEASLESEVIGEVAMGDVINEIETVVNEAGERWIKFKTGDGRDGFVNAAYLSKETDQAPIAVHRVVIPSLNVRLEPSDEAEVLGELTYFNEFSVFEKVEDEQGRVWLKIQASGSPDGFGYVLSDLTVELEQ